MIREALRPYGAPDDPAWEEFPCAMSWLCTRTWNALDPRKVGRVSLDPDPEGWRVTVWLETEAQKGMNRCRFLEDVPGCIERLCLKQEGQWVPMDRGEGARKLADWRNKERDIRKTRKYNSGMGEGTSEQTGDC